MIIAPATILASKSMTQYRDEAEIVDFQIYNFFKFDF